MTEQLNPRKDAQRKEVMEGQREGWRGKGRMGGSVEGRTKGNGMTQRRVGERKDGEEGWKERM